MADAIVKLFQEIYRHWAMENINRAVYDENAPLHVIIKVAVVDDKIVGQANVFRFKNNKSTAHLGFHVHPEYQRQGIGKRSANV